MASLRRSLLSLIACACVLGCAGRTRADNYALTGSLTADNQFIAYVSTNDSVAGTQVTSGHDWTNGFNFAAELTPGVTNYLHIWTHNDGPGAAGLLGGFAVGSGFHFANTGQGLATGTSGWQVSTVGFGASYGPVTDFGAYGIGPWYSIANYGAGGDWIWCSNTNLDCYFSVPIYPNGAVVPVRSISVTPTSASVPVGTPVPITVTATYRDGSTQNVTNDPATTYTVTHGSGFMTGNAYASSHTEAAVISVAYAWGGTTAYNAVYITENYAGHGRVVSSLLSPNSATVTYPTPVTFTFTVHYQDGTVLDVSTNPNTKYTVQHGKGVITGNSYSSNTSEAAVIMATFTDPVADQVVTQVGYIIENAPVTLKKLTLAPLSSTVLHGTPVTFKATATFSDGSIQDVSNDPNTVYAVQHGVGSFSGNTYTSPRPEAAVLTATYTNGGISASGIAYVISN